MIAAQLNYSGEGLLSKAIIDKKHRDDQIIKHVPLVKNVVDRIAMKLPSHIDKEDLINVGIIGLMSALERFDETRNVKFETYAKFRIRGAILDELRSRDVVSRSARNKDAKLEEAFLTLQKDLGRPPDEEEVASFMGISLDEYYKLLDDAKGVSILSSEDLPPDYCEKYCRDDVLENINNGNPLSIMALNQQKEILRHAIESLPKKEKIILSFYYYEELTLKEIGAILELTESRVCQIHAQAVTRLRTRLRMSKEEGNFS